MLLAAILACPCVAADDGTEQPDAAKEDEPARAARPFRIVAPEGRIEVRSSVEGGFGRVSTRRTTINGVTTIEVRRGRDITRIVEDPEEGITVETSKVYDRDNMEQLKDSHPNVYSYLEKAPRGMGPTRFRVSVEVARVYQSESAETLKKDYPEAYEVYEKHAGQGDEPRIEFPRVVPPRIRAVPRIEIRPRRVEPKKPEKKEEKKEPASEVKPER